MHFLMQLANELTEILILCPILSTRCSFSNLKFLFLVFVENGEKSDTGFKHYLSNPRFWVSFHLHPFLPLMSHPMPSSQGHMHKENRFYLEDDNYPRSRFLHKYFTLLTTVRVQPISKFNKSNTEFLKQDSALPCATAFMEKKTELIAGP